MSAPSPMILVDREAKRLESHKKTQLCKFFAMGACSRGSDCAFAHGSGQLREQPDFSKTRLCADFVEFGRCSRGKLCTFAHGKYELRPGSSAKLGRPQRHTKQGHTSSEKIQAAAAAHALQALRVQQSLHERAALALMLQSACPRPEERMDSAVGPEKQMGCFLSSSKQVSLSRQTTWAGVETEPSGFSRGSSSSSTMSESAEHAAPKDDVMSWRCEKQDVQVRVKNTFIDVPDVEEDQPQIRKTRSLPHLSLQV
mmetsp:Transcript_22338/g.51784  ORF Transcript_22338/g.51784 Transcript_22338/m.51784 type:complete len:255 (+) Transcript_22338:58-822(+)